MPKNRPAPKVSPFKITLQWLAFCFLLCSICLLIFGYALYTRVSIDLPDIKTLHHVQYQTPLRIYTRDKLLIGQFGEQKRMPIPLETVPRQLINAFLAAEDERFFKHPGVDYKGLIRAGVKLALTGKKRQGGSTITMQVTRNFLLTNEKTYIRKLKEIILALKIEREYSKNKILELYLNQIYFGHRSYGVNAAAQTYYGRPLNTLTLAETAMIAGLPKAPSAYNPIANEARAMQRRNYVLQRMLELNYITQLDYEYALKQPSTAKLQYEPVEIPAPYVAEMVRQAMVAQYGRNAYTSGLNVYTTITGALQNQANQALANALHSYDDRHGYRPADEIAAAKNLNFVDLPVIGDTFPALITGMKNNRLSAKLQNGALIVIPGENIKEVQGDIVRVRRLANKTWAMTRAPKVEGAFVALNPKNGAILALTGGFDFFRNNFNRATQSKRQPGSGFKPIIYTAALEAGFTPASIINDEPIVVENPEQETEWRPENYSRTFLGPTSLRMALTHSSNIISVRLLDVIGIEKAVSTALRFGFAQQQLPKTLSLALGSGYASPLQMAQAYSAFANGGFLIDPYFIERIESKEGVTLFQAKPKLPCPECDNSAGQTSNYAPRIMSPGICFLMNSLLREVVQNGTAADAKVLGRQDLAGKTGTTNDYRDAWFNGYTSDVAATAWVGFDNFDSLGNHETGGKTALPMWIEFMKTALASSPEAALSVPEGIVEDFIDPTTGRLAPAGGKNGVLEYFLEGSEPSRFQSVDDDSIADENQSSIGNVSDHNGEVSRDQPIESLF
jgi:penicillin-binding protein 1A